MEHFKKVMTPDILHSDNGGQFRNKIFEELKEMEGFEHIFGKGETPEHQGQIERFNRTLKSRIFTWIRANWGRVADERWHDEGLQSCLDAYNSNVHKTTNIAPDVWNLGRMKTPAQRQQHQGAVRALNLLLAGPKEGSQHTRWATLEQQAKESEFSAAVVAQHLEKQDVLHRRAISSTAKMQTANRMRRSGAKLKSLVVPKIGETVVFRRPVQDRKKYKKKQPAALANVEGTIIAVSTVGFSYYVEWQDDNDRTRQTYLFPSEMTVVGSGKGQAPEVKANKILLWDDVRMYIKEFSHTVQLSWKNTRNLMKTLGEQRFKPLKVLGALGSMDVPNIQTVNSSRYCEEVTVQILDQKFWALLQSNIDDLDDLMPDLDASGDDILAYLVRI